MDSKYRSPPEKGIQDVSLPVGCSKPFGSANSGAKENNKPYNESQLVIDLKKEVSDLTGRLFEARSSRDSALRKNVQMQEDHLLSLKRMQDVIGSLEGDNTVLRRERDVDTFARLEDLEHEVEKVRCEKTDLRLRMDNIAKESLAKDEKINELTQTIKKLETSLRHLENQKADLLDSATEQVQREKEYEMQKGALSVLEKELNKCQASWEETKEQLNLEKIKNRDLEKTFSAAEKELISAKVDVRLLTRDKKDLEEKLSKKMSTTSSYIDQIKALEQCKVKAEQQIQELGAEVKILKSKLEDQVALVAQKGQLLEDKDIKERKMSDDLRTTRKELKERQNLLSQYEKYKDNSLKLEELLKGKETSLTEKDKTIASLQQDAKMLKDACVLLEKQLEKFENVLAKQQQKLDVALKARAKAEEESTILKDELQATKSQVQELQNLRHYNERRLVDIETSLKFGESEKLQEIGNLKSRIVDMERSSDIMTGKIRDLMDRLEELQQSNDESKNLTENISSENKLLREESSRSLTEIMELKEKNSQLMSALNEAISKCEGYKSKLESLKEDFSLLEVGQAEKDLRLQAKLNQQTKLIEHLIDHNELLCNKRKKNFVEKFFAREQKEFKEPHTPVNSPMAKLIPSSSNSTPRRIIQEYNDVKNLEGETADLKNQLARLQLQRELVHQHTDDDDKVELVDEKKDNFQNSRYLRDLRNKRAELQALKKADETKEDVAAIDKQIEAVEEVNVEHGLKKSSIYREEGKERILDVNCVKNMQGTVYLFGCEQGLYSRKIKSTDKPSNHVVKIEGSGPVYQIDFIPSINFALVIEGKDRKLALVHLNLLLACAEAAACSKPKVKLQYVTDLRDCHSFQVQKTADRDHYAAVALPKYLVILLWDKDTFIVHHRLKTPDVVTSMLATPSSVIFGCDKVFELDIKTLTMEDFMDESDESIMYAMLACRESFNYPVAILDVSRSNMDRGDTNFRIEYLLCFPDFAIFVDAYGRRSRSEDIMWSKMPVGVYYKAPNLLVVHFNSVEFIELGPQSYTKTRIVTSFDSIGTEVANIPKSRFVSLPLCTYLGKGEYTPVFFAGMLTKSKFEIFEIEAPKNVF